MYQVLSFPSVPVYPVPVLKSVPLVLLVIASPSPVSVVLCYQLVLELRYHSFPSASVVLVVLVVLVVSCSKVLLARKKSAHDAWTFIPAVASGIACFLPM
jgi:hypothetical protein